MFGKLERQVQDYKRRSLQGTNELNKFYLVGNVTNASVATK